MSRDGFEKNRHTAPQFTVKTKAEGSAHVDVETDILNGASALVEVDAELVEAELSLQEAAQVVLQ